MGATPTSVGRKPRRLYVRIAVYRPDHEGSRAETVALRQLVHQLDRAGRLVAHGPLTRPAGDLLVFRAEDRSHAERVLRTDPLAGQDDVEYRVLDWRVWLAGAGVNLEPPPARGSGRVTLLASVAVVVRDLAAALRWYENVLGFVTFATDPESGYAELGLSPGSTELSLVSPQRRWGEPHYSETLARIGAQTGIIFRTDSIVAFQLRLEHEGVRITQRASREPWGRTVLRFTDPDGNEFLAYEPLPLREDGGRTRRARGPDPEF